MKVKGQIKSTRFSNVINNLFKINLPPVVHQPRNVSHQTALLDDAILQTQQQLNLAITTTMPPIDTINTAISQVKHFKYPQISPYNQPSPDSNTRLFKVMVQSEFQSNLTPVCLAIKYNLDSHQYTVIEAWIEH